VLIVSVKRAAGKQASPVENRRNSDKNETTGIRRPWERKSPTTKTQRHKEDVLPLKGEKNPQEGTEGTEESSFDLEPSTRNLEPETFAGNHQDKARRKSGGTANVRR